jgi:hypothetical protein
VIAIHLEDEIAAPRAPCRYRRGDVPPDVTTGLVVVVMGGRVVVVGGAVVVVGAAGALVAVGCGGAVVLGTVDEALDLGVCAGATVVGGTAVGGVLALALEPGCSRATVTPMKAAAPVEIRTMARVSCRRSSSTRARDSLE